MTSCAGKSLSAMSVVIVVAMVAGGGQFSIDYENSTFVKDGKPFRYASGSIHYARVHPYYWKDRLFKMKMAGLNALQTYVPWAIHEVMPDQYTFSGAADLPLFLRTAQETGLLVLLRLGPYICAEWDFGGFPAWLLTQNKDMILRTSDSSYMARVDKWFTVLLEIIKPYLYENGGPIVMVQIENEYGSYFTCDSDYMHFLYTKTRAALGKNIVIYTTDGNTDHYPKCTTEGAYATVDFGVTNDPAGAFKGQRKIEPRGPLVNSEFYMGWLNSWGQPHTSVSETAVAKSLDLLLAYQANINLYMFEGGTNFGYTGGALDKPPFLPTVTSYDEDAPLTEAGDITPKYFAVRDIISKYLELPTGQIPSNTTKAKYGSTQMKFVSTIQDALPTLCPEGPVFSTYPLHMEAVKHYYGFTLYRHKLKASVSKAALVTNGVRDRGYVMVDQIPQGMFYREEVVQVNVTGSGGEYLDILVENQGRVCYSTAINFMQKGLIYNVTLKGALLKDWEIYPIHLENMIHLPINSSGNSKAKASKNGQLMTPSIYMGQINIPHTSTQPQDSFLDMRPWVKGQAFINDFNIGRYWPQMGPQVTLYVPGPVFKSAGSNQLWVLELEHSPCSAATNNQSACRASFTDVAYIDAKPGGKILSPVPEMLPGNPRASFRDDYLSRVRLHYHDVGP